MLGPSRSILEHRVGDVGDAVLDRIVEPPELGAIPLTPSHDRMEAKGPGSGSLPSDHGFGGTRCRNLR
jgi:hypothetical protein